MRVPGRMTPASYRATLHVPLADNQGEDFDPLVIGDIEARILTAYGALTVVEAYGVWRDGDTTYSDVQKLYSVDVAHENDIHKLRDIAAFVRDTLDQVCVYVTVQNLHAYLV